MEKHGEHWPLVRRALVCVLGLCLVWPGAAAAQIACRLALVLAVDVSSSVDEVEDKLQRLGLAGALVAPDVQAAFLSGGSPVALAVFEWSGRNKQKLLLDWRLMTGPEALTDAAETLARSTRSTSRYPTAMGNALGYAALLLTRAPGCLFKTIDLAGDGINNDGFPPGAAYAEFPFDGVTVNGLVVRSGTFPEAEAVSRYYRATVLRGPGAFLEEAQDFEDYENAITRKLIREVAPRQIGAVGGSGREGPG